MTAPDYPSREHANAVRRHTSRACKELADLMAQAQLLMRRLENGHEIAAETARGLAEKATVAVERIAVLEALREVREWHAADLAEREAENAETDRLVAEHFADGHVHGGCPRDADRSEGKG